ncbi:hypothetical protein [Comamonas terrigena]|nr:hypothetical protein [Comamonas terrigena]BBL25337.1 hypothetical protein CT3_27920 [Comamonas terrigena NBRC 13299]
MTKEKKDPDLNNAVTKYQQIRVETYSAAVRQLRMTTTDSAFESLTISEIRDRAAEAYLQHWNHSLRRVRWKWLEMREQLRMKRPSYWEMAIWHKNTLCGLVLGKPSQKRTRLYIEGIEGNPAQHPLKGKIIAIALIASEMYADSIGCDQVWLVEPDPLLLDTYKRAGYNLVLPNKLLKRVFRLKSFATKEL